MSWRVLLTHAASAYIASAITIKALERMGLIKL